MAGLLDNPAFQLSGLSETGPMQTLSALQSNRAVGAVPRGAPTQQGGYNKKGGDSIEMPAFSTADVSSALDAGSERANRAVGRGEMPPPRMTGSGTVEGSDGPMGFNPKLIDLARAMAPNSDDRGNSIAAAGIGMAQAGSHGSDFLSALASGAGTGLDFFQKQRAMRADQALKQAQFQSEDQLRKAQITNLNSEATARMAPWQRLDEIMGGRGGAGPQGAGPQGAAPPPFAGAPPQLQEQLTNLSGKAKPATELGGTPLNVLQLQAIADDPILGATPFGQAAGQTLSRLMQHGVVTPDGVVAIKGSEYDPGYVKQKAAATAAGTGAGQRESGTFILNPSQGQVTPGPLGAEQRPPLTVPPPAAVAPGATGPAPGATAPTDPMVQRLALIPAAIPFTPNAKLGPAQNEQEKKMAEDLGKLPGEIDKRADDSKALNFQLNQMRNETEGWKMGKLSPSIANAKAWLQSVNSTLGEPYKLSQEDIDSVANPQAFNKNAMELARQVTRATSSRAAYQEMQMIQKALPAADMSPDGFKRISDQLQGANDFRVAQQKAKDLWLRRNDNNMNGFEEWFNDTVDPAVFMLHNLSPKDQQTVKSAVLKRTNGSADWAKLGKQMHSAYDLGLIE